MNENVLTRTERSIFSPANVHLNVKPMPAIAEQVPPTDDVPFSRDRLSLIALLILLGICIALCVLVVYPFLPGLTWALAFGVVAYPIHDWMSKHISKPDLAAFLSVTCVALVLIGPASLVGWQVGRQADDIGRQLTELQDGGGLKAKLGKYPKMAEFVGLIEEHLDIQHQATGLGEGIKKRVARSVESFIHGVIQLALALFVLFFFFRDRKQILSTAKSLIPLSRKETDEFVCRIHDMTHATVYGTVVVSAVQGLLGGLMFFFLGVPGAMLWGVVMGILSIVPMLGAFVVWAPVAAMLAGQGEIAKAIMLTAWGTLVVGLVDNLLYPALVGKEIRMHTVPVFLSIVGGLFVFGAAGIVLGPIILAATVALLEILRRRTVAGRSAAEPT